MGSGEGDRFRPKPSFGEQGLNDDFVLRIVDRDVSAADHFEPFQDVAANGRLCAKRPFATGCE
jgi:hypothetical protein